jgi:hypothetical protein
MRRAFGWLRARAGAQTRREWIAWGLLAGLLVAAPLTFTLLRAPRFEASVEMYPAPAGPFAPPLGIGYYHKMIHSPNVLAIAKNIAGTSRPPSDLERAASVRHSRHRTTFTLTVAADTPDDAREFTTALGEAIAGGSSLQVQERLTRRQSSLSNQLEAGPNSPSSAQLTARIQHLDALIQDPPERLILGERPGTPPLTHAADRFVNDLPGDFPPRPSPLLAGFAGLVLWTALWLVWTARRRTDPTHPR